MNSSTIMFDYYHGECFDDTELHKECLLVAIYVYYLKLTQPENFNHTMKKNLWLGKSVQAIL